MIPLELNLITRLKGLGFIFGIHYILWCTDVLIDLCLGCLTKARVSGTKQSLQPIREF